MKNQIQKIILGLFVVLILSLFSGCYSLNGIALDPRIKTVQIDVFPNYAPLQNIRLSQDFTNDLRDRFQQRTPLTVTKTDGDIVISGEITDYKESYTAVTSDNTSRNRLTIRIKVNYVNKLEEKKSFSKTFEAYQDYDGDRTLTDVEGSLVPLITKDIIDQIYNAVANDW